MPVTVRVGEVAIAADRPLTYIGGPCVIESREHARSMALRLRDLTAELGIPFVFKASVDKANRTAGTSYRGPGFDAGLEILAAIRDEVGVPVVTDIHEVAQVERVAAVVDLLQIPAFLCRQTDLVEAAAASGAPVNIKKGQFLSPMEMHAVAAKAAATGTDQILLTERGFAFGYQNLVSDMRALPIMAEAGYPVVYDAGHSVQQPGGLGSASGGQRQFIRPLARAAVAVGIAALFLETHDDPEHALSDGPNSYPLDALAGLLRELRAIDGLVKGA